MTNAANTHVDVAIIGTGTAGMGAYREVRKHTNSIALIEGGKYGTTCARVGCMPSKLLIAPGELRHRAEKFNEFGLEGSIPSVNGKAVMKRVREERDRFVSFVNEDIEGFDETHRIEAYAKFINDHTLSLSTGGTITADKIIIATGSRPNIPAFFESAKDRLITNDDVFYWEDLPKSVAVFGAGVIGLELGQALHRLGVKTHLFGVGDSVGPLSDPEVISNALEIFKEEFSFHSNGQVKRIIRSDNGVQITFKATPDSEERVETFDYLLAATGRKANVDNIGLENTSVTLDSRGVPQYNPMSMQCGNSHIFIAGDVNGDIPLLHEASDEGRLAGENASSYPQVFRKARKASLGIVFSDPQIATVGMSFKALSDKKGCEFATGSVSFTGQGRSRVMLVNKGLLRVYGDKETGVLLGAEMIGPHNEHIAHLLAWVIQMRMTVADVLQLPFYHPVIEEGLRTALRDLLFNLGMGAHPPLRCIDCGPGA
jgi:dihydrolipoamide dehydrogenase